MSSQITYKEYTDSIKRLANGKSPGIDGIPNEFYKIFIGLIGPSLYEVLKDEIKCGNLGETKSKSVVALLFKKNERDLFKPKNYRPVALLCSDYKIYTGVLANRLGAVMHHIIKGPVVVGKTSKAGLVTGRVRPGRGRPGWA